MEAREAIVRAAERLIAERGPGIPLRDIALEAGQRNNSAVHYHFGSRDELIRAIVERRMEPLEKRQLELLTEYETSHAADDVRALVEVLARPMFHVPYAEGSTHYGRFLEQVRNHPVIAQAQLDVDHWPTVRMITARLGKALGQLPAATRRRRLASMSRCCSRCSPTRNVAANAPETSRIRMPSTRSSPCSSGCSPLVDDLFLPLRFFYLVSSRAWYPRYRAVGIA